MEIINPGKIINPNTIVNSNTIINPSTVVNPITIANTSRVVNPSGVINPGTIINPIKIINPTLVQQVGNKAPTLDESGTMQAGTFTASKGPTSLADVFWATGGFIISYSVINKDKAISTIKDFGTQWKNNLLDPFRGQGVNTIVNGLTAIGEDLDILASPVKAAIADIQQHNSMLSKNSNLYKTTIGGDEGRLQYDWNTGNLFLDLLGEFASDPLNWVGLGSKGLAKLGITKLAKEASEETAQRSGKLITKVFKGTDPGLIKATLNLGADDVLDIGTTLKKAGTLANTTGTEILKEIVEQDVLVEMTKKTKGGFVNKLQNFINDIMRSGNDMEGPVTRLNRVLRNEADDYLKKLPDDVKELLLEAQFATKESADGLIRFSDDFIDEISLDLTRVIKDEFFDSNKLIKFAKTTYDLEEGIQKGINRVAFAETPQTLLGKVAWDNRKKLSKLFDATRPNVLRLSSIADIPEGEALIIKEGAETQSKLNKRKILKESTDAMLNKQPTVTKTVINSDGTLSTFKVKENSTLNELVETLSENNQDTVKYLNDNKNLNVCYFTYDNGNYSIHKMTITNPTDIALAQSREAIVVTKSNYNTLISQLKATSAQDLLLTTLRSSVLGPFKTTVLAHLGTAWRNDIDATLKNFLELRGFKLSIKYSEAMKIFEEYQNTMEVFIRAVADDDTLNYISSRLGPNLEGLDAWLEQRGRNINDIIEKKVHYKGKKQSVADLFNDNKWITTAEDLMSDSKMMTSGASAVNDVLADDLAAQFIKRKNLETALRSIDGLDINALKKETNAFLGLIGRNPKDLLEDLIKQIKRDNKINFKVEDMISLNTILDFKASDPKHNDVNAVLRALDKLGLMPKEEVQALLNINKFTKEISKDLGGDTDATMELIKEITANRNKEGTFGDLLEHLDEDDYTEETPALFRYFMYLLGYNTSPDLSDVGKEVLNANLMNLEADLYRMPQEEYIKKYFGIITRNTNGYSLGMGYRELPEFKDALAKGDTESVKKIIHDWFKKPEHEQYEITIERLKQKLKNEKFDPKTSIHTSSGENIWVRRQKNNYPKFTKDVEPNMQLSLIEEYTDPITGVEHSVWKNTDNSITHITDTSAKERAEDIKLTRAQAKAKRLNKESLYDNGYDIPDETIMKAPIASKEYEFIPNPALGLTEEEARYVSHNTNVNPYLKEQQELNSTLTKQEKEIQTLVKQRRKLKEQPTQKKTKAQIQEKIKRIQNTINEIETEAANILDKIKKQYPDIDLEDLESIDFDTINAERIRQKWLKNSTYSEEQLIKKFKTEFRKNIDLFKKDWEYMGPSIEELETEYVETKKQQWFKKYNYSEEYERLTKNYNTMYDNYQTAYDNLFGEKGYASKLEQKYGDMSIKQIENHLSDVKENISKTKREINYLSNGGKIITKGKPVKTKTQLSRLTKDLERLQKEYDTYMPLLSNYNKTLTKYNYYDKKLIRIKTIINNKFNKGFTTQSKWKYKDVEERISEYMFDLDHIADLRKYLKENKDALTKIPKDVDNKEYIESINDQIKQLELNNHNINKQLQQAQSNFNRLEDMRKDVLYSTEYRTQGKLIQALESKGVYVEDLDDVIDALDRNVLTLDDLKTAGLDSDYVKIRPEKEYEPLTLDYSNLEGMSAELNDALWLSSREAIDEEGAFAEGRLLKKATDLSDFTNESAAHYAQLGYEDVANRIYNDPILSKKYNGKNIVHVNNNLAQDPLLNPIEVISARFDMEGAVKEIIEHKEDYPGLYKSLQKLANDAEDETRVLIEEMNSEAANRLVLNNANKALAAKELMNTIQSMDKYEVQKIFRNATWLLDNLDDSLKEGDTDRIAAVFSMIPSTLTRRVFQNNSLYETMYLINVTNNQLNSVALYQYIFNVLKEITPEQLDEEVLDLLLDKFNTNEIKNNIKVSLNRLRDIAPGLSMKDIDTDLLQPLEEIWNKAFDFRANDLQLGVNAFFERYSKTNREGLKNQLIEIGNNFLKESTPSDIARANVQKAEKLLEKQMKHMILKNIAKDTDGGAYIRNLIDDYIYQQRPLLTSLEKEDNFSNDIITQVTKAQRADAFKTIMQGKQEYSKHLKEVGDNLTSLVYTDVMNYINEGQKAYNPIASAIIEHLETLPDALHYLDIYRVMSNRTKDYNNLVIKLFSNGSSESYKYLNKWHSIFNISYDDFRNPAYFKRVTGKDLEEGYNSFLDKFNHGAEMYHNTNETSKIIDNREEIPGTKYTSLPEHFNNWLANKYKQATGKEIVIQYSQKNDDNFTKWFKETYDRDFDKLVLDVDKAESKRPAKINALLKEYEDSVKWNYYLRGTDNLNKTYWSFDRYVRQNHLKGDWYISETAKDKKAFETRLKKLYTKEEKELTKKEKNFLDTVNKAIAADQTTSADDYFKNYNVKSIINYDTHLSNESRGMSGIASSYDNKIRTEKRTKAGDIDDHLLDDKARAHGKYQDNAYTFLLRMWERGADNLDPTEAYKQFQRAQRNELSIYDPVDQVFGETLANPTHIELNSNVLDELEAQNLGTHKKNFQEFLKDMWVAEQYYSTVRPQEQLHSILDNDYLIKGQQMQESSEAFKKLQKVYNNILDIIKETKESKEYNNLLKMHDGESKELNNIVKYLDIKEKIDKYQDTIKKVPGTEYWLNAFNRVEQRNRTYLMQNLQDLGYTVNEAIDKGINAHFDYSSKPKWLANLETIIPFATYPIENTKFWAQQILDENPDMLRHIIRLNRASNQLQSRTEYERQRNNALLNNFQTGNINLSRLFNMPGTSREGKDDVIFKSGNSLLDAIGLLMDPVGAVEQRTIIPTQARNLLNLLPYGATGSAIVNNLSKMNSDKGLAYNMTKLPIISSAVSSQYNYRQPQRSEAYMRYLAYINGYQGEWAKYYKYNTNTYKNRYVNYVKNFSAYNNYKRYASNLRRLNYTQFYDVNPILKSIRYRYSFMTPIQKIRSQLNVYPRIKIGGAYVN